MMQAEQIWTKKSGNTIATVNENDVVAIDLPLIDSVDSTAIQVEVISGKLPSGLRVNGNQITGTPIEVPIETKVRFVLRATYNGHTFDRTFNIVVVGSDLPVWKTPEDLLPAGANDQYFVLDNSYVDFQLVVEDDDIKAGQVLRYSLKSGQIPPGLALTHDGKIQGIVDPILAIEKSIKGGYDAAPYDYGAGTGYDWYSAIANSTNGYDSYYYDLVKYDISVNTRTPKKLNRYYQFTVDVTDGESVIPRTFRIFVVGDDFFTADITTMQAGTGTFTADASKLRRPIWLTPGDFGYRRANNYISLPLQVINNSTISGLVWYRMEEINDDGTDSVLPPGLGLDFRNGYIVGRTPYQKDITETYKFTVSAIRVSFDSERVELQQKTEEAAALNSATLKISKTEKVTATDLIGRTFTVEGNTYKILLADLSHTDYDLITLTYGTRTVMPKGTGINLGIFDLTEAEEAKSTKTFTVNLLGEVNSEITWITSGNLGSVSANYTSTKRIQASTSVPNATLVYRVQSGSLPPGMRLDFSGELIGTVKSFGNTSEQGLTVFDNGATKFDANTTRMDRQFEFTVEVKDHFGYSITTRTFTLVVDDPNNKEFSNLHLKPMLTRKQRDTFRDIIGDPQIFLPEQLYRQNDTNFGIQYDLTVLLYAGIETKNMRYYVAAANLYGKRKTYSIGELRTAVAKEPGTQNVIYEVVYLDLVDPNDTLINRKTRKSYTHQDHTPLLVNSSHYDVTDETYDSDPYELVVTTKEQGDIVVDFTSSLDIETRDNGVLQYLLAHQLFVYTRLGNILEVSLQTIGSSTNYELRPSNPNVVTVDMDLYTTDGIYKNKKTISSITNIREEILKIGETEKDFLPLWMQTPQTTIAEIGYVPALVLCYCKPGGSTLIKEKIENQKINFKQFELDIDRVVIDNAESNADDQYLVFQNKEYVV